MFYFPNIEEKLVFSSYYFMDYHSSGYSYLELLMIGPNPDEDEEDWIFGFSFILYAEPFISYDQRGVAFYKYVFFEEGEDYYDDYYYSY